MGTNVNDPFLGHMGKVCVAQLAMKMYEPADGLVTLDWSHAWEGFVVLIQ